MSDDEEGHEGVGRTVREHQTSLSEEVRRRNPSDLVQSVELRGYPRDSGRDDGLV